MLPLYFTEYIVFISIKGTIFFPHNNLRCVLQAKNYIFLLFSPPQHCLKIFAFHLTGQRLLLFFLTKLSQNNLPCMLQAKGYFLFLLLTPNCLKIMLCILHAKCYFFCPTNCLKILPCILQAKAYFFISFFSWNIVSQKWGGFLGHGDTLINFSN